MVKRRIKAKKPESEEVRETVTNTDAVQSAPVFEDIEEQITAIIEKGKKKGFLTYEQINEDLPEGAVSPARLDNLLATLDEIGVSLLDEADVVKHEIVEEDFEDEKAIAESETTEEDNFLEKQLVAADSSKKVDDPITAAVLAFEAFRRRIGRSGRKLQSGKAHQHLVGIVAVATMPAPGSLVWSILLKESVNRSLNDVCNDVVCRGGCVSS